MHLNVKTSTFWKIRIRVFRIFVVFQFKYIFPIRVRRDKGFPLATTWHTSFIYKDLPHRKILWNPAELWSLDIKKNDPDLPLHKLKYFHRKWIKCYAMTTTKKVSKNKIITHCTEQHLLLNILLYIFHHHNFQYNCCENTLLISIFISWTL